MRSETALWIALRDHGLGAFGELTRIESPITPGLPDVHYALVCPWGNAHGQGWIELKCVARAPARAATPVRYKYRFMQPEFLHRQWELGGHAYVLGQVGQEYLLHKGERPICGWRRHRAALGHAAQYRPIPFFPTVGSP